MTAEPTKRCAKCREVLPLSDFGSHRSRKDGLNNYCKACARAQTREVQRRVRATEEGRERHNARQRNLRATTEGRERHRAASRASLRKLRATPEGRERINISARERARKLRATPEGRARSNAASLAWQKANPEKAWKKANPEKAAALSQRRRARKLDLPATLTSADWQEILAAFSHACAYCGTTDRSLTQEHVIPVVKGGGYTRENIVPACGPCNSSKGDRDLDRWLAWKFPEQADEIAARVLALVS